MKLNKKIIVSSLILATITAPSVGLVSHNDSNIVQAATSSKKNSIKLISTKNDIKIPVYDRQGKQINGSTVESGANLNIVGKPIILQQKYPKQDIFESVKINGKTYTSLGDGGYIPTNTTGGYTSKGMKIMRNTAVYNKNGKKLSTYRGRTATLKKVQL